MNKAIQDLKKIKFVPGVKGTQTVIPEGTWLKKKKKEKHFQTTSASDFHLKLILWHAVQAISNVKLNKNIIPNHN